MRIINDSLQVRDIYKISHQSDVLAKRVGQRLARSNRLARLRRVDEFPENIHSGARAAYGHAPRNQAIERLLHGGALPIIDVIRLIAARNPKRFSAFDCTNNKRVICRGPVWNDQGRDGILVWTKLLDVRIIGVRPGSSNNKKVPIATSLAHPLESGIH